MRWSCGAGWRYTGDRRTKKRSSKRRVAHRAHGTGTGHRAQSKCPCERQWIGYAPTGYWMDRRPSCGHIGVLHRARRSDVPIFAPGGRGRRPPPGPGPGMAFSSPAAAHWLYGPTCVWQVTHWQFLLRRTSSPTAAGSLGVCSRLAGGGVYLPVRCAGAPAGFLLRQLLLAGSVRPHLLIAKLMPLNY